MKKAIRALAFSAALLSLLFLAMQARTQTEKKAAAKTEKKEAKKVISKEEKIKRAMMAGPASISAGATILDWDMTELRKGTNDWTCLPDRLGNDPWCMDKSWLTFLNAYVKKETPTITQIGFAYMLVGDSAVSNTDPFATAPTPDNEWIPSGGPHLMILVPNKEALAGLPTKHSNGGPFVMWANTPFAHIMVPLGEPKHSHMAMPGHAH
ncbi:MAG: hypothetical protein LAN71_03720 [Acidobacteriia bacterium]|nr:hypothetical protein [Terriglobia bacterium]